LVIINSLQRLPTFDSGFSNLFGLVGDLRYSAMGLWLTVHCNGDGVRKYMTQRERERERDRGGGKEKAGGSSLSASTSLSLRTHIYKPSLTSANSLFSRLILNATTGSGGGLGSKGGKTPPSKGMAGYPSIGTGYAWALFSSGLPITCLNEPRQAKHKQANC